VKVTSTHVLPALVTLGSDQNLNVKYASIDAFGAVAQHFKNEMVLLYFKTLPSFKLFQLWLKGGMRNIYYINIIRIPQISTAKW
jgi:hypothetical protein